MQQSSKIQEDHIDALKLCIHIYNYQGCDNYRIYDPDNDGKNKLDHVHEMLVTAVASKALSFNRVLMDTWYATKELMLLIDSLGKIFYCPIKANRQVDDSGGALRYRRVDSLEWRAFEKDFGKSIKTKEFPKDCKVKLFRVEVSSNRTDWVVTNDLAQDSTQGTQNVCALRWKIEQFHRELKQLTGVEKCQARKSRIQRNHIACAVLDSIDSHCQKGWYEYLPN